MMTDDQPAKGLERISIPRLRKWFGAVLTLAVVGFTAGVSLLVDQIFDDFGPGVREDLIWKTVRGAQELARATDLGFAMRDQQTVVSAFGQYRTSKDVMAIVAIDPKGAVIATHGGAPEAPGALFAGQPGQLRETAHYFVSWAGSFIESAEVGRVAVVVSTRRLVESRERLRQILFATIAAGAVVWLGGLVVVSFFARGIAKRDARLAGYASTLERKVQERTAELDRRNRGMRLVLDNVDQGFITVDRDGVMEPERSAIVDRWLGTPQPGQTFQDYVRPRDATASDWFQLGVAALRDDHMPVEVTLDQLPRRMAVGAAAMKLDYIAINEGGTLQRLLIVVSDVTAALAREQLQREHAEMAHLYHAVSSDRPGFEEFLDEANQLVARLNHVGLVEAPDPVLEKRLVHTLKGACGLYQLPSVVDICHVIESRMAEDGGALGGGDRQAITQAWDRVAQHARELLGERRYDVIELALTDYQHLRTLIQGGAPHRELAMVLDAWTMEALAPRLRRLGKQAQQLAGRLGKPPVEVLVEANGVHVEPGVYAAFFTSLVHVVRNAVDHGIESVERRRAQGKPETATLALSSRLDAGRLVVTVTDDGAGVDWAKLAERARAAGLPDHSHELLVEALFADGVSTRDQVSSVSGRGVGLAAVRAALLELGGSVRVHSQDGRGTTFEFSFPPADTLSQHHAA
jgi:HPt (histidine-containing phosphotransfer) domain-containing protein